MLEASEAATEVVLRSGRPLSVAQRALWASQRTNPNHPVQNMVEVATIAALDADGAPSIDPARLADAFASVVDASDVLRTRIVTDRGEDRVVVGAADGSALTTLVPLERASLDEWVARRSAVPIDMAIRSYDSVIITHEDGAVTWYLGLHHTVTDATASTLVFRMTAAAYDGNEISVGSYYQWADRRQRLADRRIERAAAYWRARPSAPEVREMYTGDLAPTPVSHRVPIPLSADLLERLEHRLEDDLRLLSLDLGWSTLLMTVAATLIHRVSGVDRFAIGLPVHHRNEPASRSVVGPVMQVYPVDIEVEDDDTFRSLYARIARSALEAVRHAGPAGPPTAADYQVVMNLIPDTEQPQFAGRPTDVRWVHAGAADPHHLLRFQFTRFGERPELFIDINEAAASPDQHQRVVTHVERILEALAAEPESAIGSVRLPADEEVDVLRSWGQGSSRRPASFPPSVGARLREALSESTSIVLESSATDEQFTGRELWDQVQAAAGWFAEQGVGPGSRVAIDMPRSVETVIAIFGVAVAGGSFVPLDPAHPAERRKRLVERAGCVLVVDRLPANLASPANQQSQPSKPDDEAYLLFTSGSTGEPKGVPIANRGLLDYLDFALDNYVSANGAPVGALFSALTFDLTITSLFVPLLAGGRLVVVEPEGPSGLRSVVDHDSIDWIKATPSHLELLLSLSTAGTSGAATRPGQLRTVIVGGEAFGAQLARKLETAFPEAAIFNEYGPTEAVVGCMIHQWSCSNGGGVDVPIGRPAPGVELRILDRHDQPVPVGAPGELHVAHRGVTAGYLGDSDEERFVELDGTRFYRSGDLVRLLDDETLGYQGRIDEQLKVGGIRLDPTEVEHAIVEHPSIERAVVRMWEPANVAPAHHCIRCGLPDNVPGASFDDHGVCETCHSYDAIKGQAEAWFRSTDDLLALRDRARAERTGRYDAVHLLSGGKDSTYALYQLVELGFEVLCLTLDNGFISEGALSNVRRSVADLGIDHEIMTSEVMNEIFQDSLDRHSNVCHGCYKTIYTLATQRAEAEGAPLIFTGLSRGQLFETRLIPEQFAKGRFDPEAIDAATLQARRVYHRLDDGPNRLLDTTVFDAESDGNGDVFDRISYIDFYRYVDVELAEMLDYLEHRAPWVRPSDTGRSTNCLVNAAGIYTHLNEQGFHNYAEPYAWDVRLGHKTRAEAMEELDDQLDLTEVSEMLDTIGYEPRPRQVLTAWIEGGDGVDITKLRTFLADRLPRHAIPTAYLSVASIPLNANGKIDVDRLPPPSRIHRAGPSLYVSAETPLESSIVDLWEAQLGVEPIGVDDDFFALGGDSLAALKMVVLLSLSLGRTIREDLAFTAPTPRQLAAAIEATEADDLPSADSTDGPESRQPGTAPSLSSGEQALLFEHLADPGSPRYNVARRYRIEGDVDPERFRHALVKVIERHAPLHWTYSEQRRRLSPSEALSFTDGGQPVAGDEFAKASVDLHRLPFDLDEGPLVRCLVQPLDGGETGIALVLHHLSIDAGTFDTLWSDLEAHYQGRPLDDLPIEYGDHTAWQDQRWSEADSRASEFWSEGSLARQTAELHMGAPDGSAPDGYVQRTALFGLEQLRAAAATTPFATALAALAATLRPRADGDAIPIAITASTRDHPLSDGLVGYYLNTLPLVVDTKPGTPLRELASQTGELLARSLAHRTYPFSRMVADRRLRNLPEPNVDVMLAFEELAPASLGTLPASHEVLASGEAVAGATFFVQVRGSAITLGLEYAGWLLTSDAAHRLLEDFHRMLRSAIEAGDSVVEVVDEAARKRLSQLAAGPKASPSAFPSLHSLFERSAELQPQAIALVQGQISLSYGELERRANLLAKDLVENDIRPGTPVGVVASRSVDSVVAILAVLKAGGAYVPIDPEYPELRRRQITEDADLGPLLNGELTEEHLGAPDPGPPLVDITPESPAYLIFTSGSTGRPKGVVVSHDNIVQSTAARQHVYQAPVESFLLLSSFAFDSSMVGLWWSLSSGGTVVLPDADRHSDTRHLTTLIADHQVTHLLALPSLYRVLLEEGPAGFHSLSTAIVAGEPCPPELAAEHATVVPQARLWNEYGPTEGTVWSHVHEVTAADACSAVPIGRPIPNVTGHVLDANLRLVPEGLPGELVLGGAGVATGYMNRPDLTDESFVVLPEEVDPRPERYGEDRPRFYRTGDLVRWLPNGSLEFLGRVDEQVKIRGHRVELGDIESAARSLPGIRDAAADAVPGSSGGLQIALWFVGDHDSGAGDLSEADVQTALRNQLPDAMVPTHVRRIDAVPLTPNGKIDRPSLPDPRAIRSVGIEQAESPDEQLVAIVWEDVLGVSGIGRLDNFLDLGGDSIMSIQIVSRLRRRGLAVSTRDVFDHPTVAELAATATPVGATKAEQGLLAGTAPLLPIQQWFLDQKVTNPHHFTQSRWIGLGADVDPDRLLAALPFVVEQHDLLRTRLDPSANTLVFSDDASFDVAVLADGAAGKGAVGNGAARRALAHRTEGLLDIVRGPTAAVRLIPADAGRPAELFVTVHHLLIDAVSWTPLLEDWEDAYNQLSDRQQPVFGPKSSSARQWATALEQWQPTIGHQRSSTSPEPSDDTSLWSSRLDLSEDETLSGTIQLEAGSSRRLLTGGATETCLLAGLAHGLRAAMSVDRPVITVEGHGRQEDIAEDLDLSRTVGWFTTHHHRPVVVAGDPNDTVGNLVSSAWPFRGLADGVVAWRATRQVPANPAQLSVLLNYLGQQTFERTSPSVTDSSIFDLVGPLLGGVDPANHRLHGLGVVAAFVDGRLTLTWDHHPAQISSAEVAEIMAVTVDVLEYLAVGASGDNDDLDLGLVSFDGDELAELGDLLDDLDS